MNSTVKTNGRFSKSRGLRASVPSFSLPHPLLPNFCSRLIFRAARMRINSFARPQFRSRGTGTLATQAKPLATFGSCFSSKHCLHGFISVCVNLSCVYLYFSTFFWKRDVMSPHDHGQKRWSEQCSGVGYHYQAILLCWRRTAALNICLDLFKLTYLISIYNSIIVVFFSVFFSFEEQNIFNSVKLWFRHLERIA